MQQSGQAKAPTPKRSSGLHFGHAYPPKACLMEVGMCAWLTYTHARPGTPVSL
jgi:hypothetical protein